MRAALIKMNLEADDIFLSIPFGAPVIDIFCPLFDFRTSLEMAVVSTLLIHELLMAQWMKQEKVLDINDVIDTVYCYSRELEHSDSNLNLMQEFLQESNE